MSPRAKWLVFDRSFKLGALLVAIAFMALEWNYHRYVSWLTSGVYVGALTPNALRQLFIEKAGTILNALAGIVLVANAAALYFGITSGHAVNVAIGVCLGLLLLYAYRTIRDSPFLKRHEELRIQGFDADEALP